MATVSFKSDIVPLFTSTDIGHVEDYDVHLNDYDWMSQPTTSPGFTTRCSTG